MEVARKKNSNQAQSDRVTSPWRLLLYWLVGIFFVLACIVTTAVTYLNAPTGEEYPVSFTIEPGTGVQEITTQLQNLGVIRSDTFFYFVLVTFFDPTAIKASTYVIDEPLTAMALAQKLIQGDFDNDLIRFTHFEGESVIKIASNASRELVNFSESEFISLALPLEGRLFPDTYFIPETFTATDLVALLNQSFEKAIAPYSAQISESSLTLEQILILASIIEREANTEESMRLVSSVLQNRLQIGMPLQADASIEYILDKPLAELTPADLEIDSPYNTYVNPGLPPTPIGNPGLTAITAVLEPAESTYFFYITDSEGTFYFSETYDEHLDNINRYLR